MADSDPDGVRRRSPAVLALLIAGLSMLGPFATDTPLPGFTAMSSQFAVDSARLQLVVGSYLFAFGVMSVIHGPLSDAVGRKPVVIGGVACFGLASVGCALSPSLPVLLGFRVMQGLSAGGGVIVSRTIIRDLYAGAEAQRLISRVLVIFGLAPALAPIAGGWIVQVTSWRGIFWLLVAWSVLLIVAALALLPESHPPHARTPLSLTELVTGLREVARDVRFNRLAWSSALLFAAIFLYIGGAAIVVVDLWGQGELDFWKLFIPLIAGMTSGAWLSGRAAGRVAVHRLVSTGVFCAIGGSLLAVAFALIPATSAQLPWAMIGPMVASFGVQLAFPSLQIAILDLFPARRGAAASMGAFVSLTVNAVFSAFLVPVVARTMFGLTLAALVLTVVGAVLWFAEPGITPRRQVRAS